MGLIFKCLASGGLEIGSKKKCLSTSVQENPAKIQSVFRQVSIRNIACDVLYLQSAREKYSFKDNYACTSGA